MRKTVEVIGIGERKLGVSKKTNQKYDFTEVAIAFEHKRFNGRRCEVVAIDCEMLEQHPLSVGEVFDAEVYEMNFKTRIACIYE